MIKKSLFLCLTACALLATTPTLQAKKIKPTRDTLTLIGFNDFHGSFQQTADIPGAAALVYTLGQWRQTSPNMHVLAGGDNYSGGYFTRITGGKPLAELFEALGVEYSAIGNHEFDWGIPAMVERLNWGSTRYLCANIFLDTLAQTRPDWAIPYVIVHETLKNGTPLRLAFIGLATPETKTTAMPAIVKDLYFENPVECARRVREQLADSADVYILLTHIGTLMDGNEVIFRNTWEDVSVLEGIDGIFSGHSHKQVCGLRNGIPVVQASNYGRKFSQMRFEVSRDAKGKVSHRFLDAEILTPLAEQDSAMLALVSSYLENPEYGFSEVVCHNRQYLSNDEPLAPSGFTLLGTLVTRSYAWCYRTLTQDSVRPVIGVCNWGSIRTTMPEGNITRLQAGNILPFGGRLGAFEFNGSELLRLLQYGMDCKAGWLQYHDMEIEVTDGKIQKAFYIAPDGTRSEILPEETYIVVTENFLSSGGDGYDAQLFGRPDATFAAQPDAPRNPTDVFINYLRHLRHVAPPTQAAPRMLNGN